MSASTLSLALCLLLAVTGSAQVTPIVTYDLKSLSETAARDIISRYSGDDAASSSSSAGLTAAQFESFLVAATHHSGEYVEQVLGPCDETEDSGNCTWKDACPGTSEIFSNFAPNGQLEAGGLVQALPVAVNTLTRPSCASGAGAQETLLHDKEKKRPTTMQTWLFGLGCCLMVIVISNVGAFLKPCMETQFYKRLLQFLVSMGAGSLASTGLLVLIPEAFDIMSVDELAHSYVWKATVAILSIFTFFGSERMLKTFLYKRKNKNRASNGEDGAVRFNGGGDGVGAELISNNSEKSHGHSHVGQQGSTDRMTLAWMVMAGDVIHNFVDGLAMGAAFTENISLGLSVSLAIVCEELPHELADVAILLHSGLKMKQAIFINFLSACVIFLGLVLGITVGSTIHEANKWIFAMAGGLFLYVPLVDMLPDMGSHLDTLMARGGHEAKIVTILQMLGLLVGTGIIVFIVNVSGCIDV